MVRKGRVAPQSRGRYGSSLRRSKELAAGYWILPVKSMDEAVESAKRVPFEALARIYPDEYGAVGEIEIRQLFELGRCDALS